MFRRRTADRGTYRGCFERHKGSAFILQKIADAKIGASISENILKDAEQYIGRTTVEILMATGLGNMLSEIIDNQIRKNAPETVENSVRQIRRDVLSMRLCDVYAKYRNRIPSIAESATQLYRRILENGNTETHLCFHGKMWYAVTVEA